LSGIARTPALKISPKSVQFMDAALKPVRQQPCGIRNFEHSMNVVIEVARSPQNDDPNQQHETNGYDGRHLILPRSELLSPNCYTAIIAIYSMLIAVFHPD
jgi:hypothetical protein